MKIYTQNVNAKNKAVEDRWVKAEDVIVDGVSLKNHMVRVLIGVPL